MHEQLITPADILAEFQVARDEFARRVEQATMSIRYGVAMEVVLRIDAHLQNGTQHYRTKAGQLLTTLDQVVAAILANDLAIESREVI